MKSRRLTAARAFGRKFFSVHPSEVWSVDLTSAPPVPEQTRFELRRITSPDDPLLDDLDSDLFDHAYYRKCLARGDFGLAALDGEICAGRTWVTSASHRDPYTGLRITLGPGEAFSFGSWVEPSYSRLGAASVLLAAAGQEAKRDGATVFYGAVENRNTAMQQVGTPLGWSKNEDVTFVRVLNRLGLQVPLTVRPRTGPAAPRPRHFAQKLFSVHPAHMWSVDVTSAQPVPEQTRFELRRITSPDDPLLDDLDSDLFDHTYYRKCLARGDVGLAALDGTTCAGRTWVTTASHRDKYSGLRIVLGAGEAWCFGLWVEPRYRLRGMGLILLAGSMRELTRDGTTVFHGVVESDNKASQAVLTALGWEKHGDVVFVRILNRLGVQVPFSVRPHTGPVTPRRPKSVRSVARKLFSAHPTQTWSADLTVELPPQEASTFEVRRITSSDDPLLGDLGSDAFDHAYYRKCLARGDFGVAALDGATCAGRVWVSAASHRDAYTGLHITLGRGEAWCFGLWVEQRYRGLGVASVILESAMRELQRDGTTVCYAVIERGNSPSQATASAAGWVRNGEVQFVRILNRVGLQVPFSMRPRTGPVGARRRIGS